MSLCEVWGFGLGLWGTATQNPYDHDAPCRPDATIRGPVWSSSTLHRGGLGARCAVCRWNAAWRVMAAQVSPAAGRHSRPRNSFGCLDRFFRGDDAPRIRGRRPG